MQNYFTGPQCLFMYPNPDKPEKTNNKSQITNKSQISSTKFQTNPKFQLPNLFRLFQY